jgi:hypothetical protein
MEVQIQDAGPSARCAPQIPDVFFRDGLPDSIAEDVGVRR